MEEDKLIDNLKEISDSSKELDKVSAKEKVKKALSSFINDLVKNNEFKGEKGEKGDKGDDGYTPIKGVDYFDGEDGIDGIDGKDADEENIVKKVIKKILLPKDGKDGKDGSPDSPIQISEKLNTLEEVLDLKVLKNSKDLLSKKEFNTFSNQVYTKGQIDMRWHGGGATTFTALRDVPDSFTGEAGNTLQVNSTEDALEYVTKGQIFVATSTATLTGTTNETTLIGSGIGTLTLPAGFLTVGKTIRITARGNLTSPVAPTTVVFKLKLGSNVIIQSASITPGTSQTARSWGMISEIITRTIGASGEVIGNGQIYNTATPAWNSIGAPRVAEFQSTSTVTVDTTASQVIDFTGTLTSGAGTDSYSITNFIVEVL